MMEEKITSLGYPDARIKLVNSRYLIEDVDGNCLDAGDNEITAGRVLVAVIKQKAERGDPTAVKWLEDRDAVT